MIAMLRAHGSSREIQKRRPSETRCRGLGREDPYPAEFQRVQFLTSRSIESRKRGASSRRGGFGREIEIGITTGSRENGSALTVGAFLSREIPSSEVISPRKKPTGGDACATVYNIPSPMFVCVRTCVYVCVYIFSIIYI